MAARIAVRRTGAADSVDAVRRRAAAVVRASGMRRPPFAPERYAGRCGVSAIVASDTDGARLAARRAARESGSRTVLVVDRRLPPHTPQWNGAVALGLADTFVAPEVPGDARQTLVETAAAELLLPMTAFRPVALRTDLTIDGLCDLAMRFAAPLRLAARQWLQTGRWHGYALLWREEDGVLRLRWRAASAGRFSSSLALGAAAGDVWSSGSRLFATLRTGRPHHGVEEVRTGSGTAWWFTRFAALREAGPARAAGPAARAVFAMVLLAGGPARPERPRRAAGTTAASPAGGAAPRV
jgi:hypothetical protein